MLRLFECTWCRHRVGIVVLTAWLLGYSPAVFSLTTEYDVLIERARGGDYQPALDYLRSKRGDEVRVRYLSDHLIIANWAGNDAEAVALYEQADHLPISMDALAAVGRSYRNLRDWPGAIAVFREGLKRRPRSAELRAGLMLALSDAGRHREAVELGRSWVSPQTTQASLFVALGYAHRRGGEPYAALFAFDRAYSLAPEDERIREHYVLALQQAGLPAAALAHVDAHTSKFGDPRYRRLQADLLAECVRLAVTTTRREDERFLLADRALALSLRLLDGFGDHPDTAQDSIRVRIDRLGALHARQLMQPVIDEYRLLRQDGIDVPPYARRWVASAMLYRRQPVLAAELYESLLQQPSADDAQRLADQQGLFYARLENQRYDGLMASANAMADGQAARLPVPGLRNGRPNNAWLDAQVMKASTHLYLNDTPAAQAAYESLIARAPNNSQIRIGLAQIYRARGWPRRAEGELKIAESAEPTAISVEVQQAYTAFELQEWRQFDLLTADVVARYPESLAVQRLDHLREVHQSAELRINGYAGESKGSTVNASGDFGIDALLYSPPVDDGFRLFAGAGYAQGKFTEGQGRHRWQRAGIEWRSRDVTLQGDVSHHDFGHGDRTGWQLSGVHDIDDQWRWGWSVAGLSDDTPLRALNADIDADGANLFVRWRQHDRREVVLSVQGLDFSDGNRRRGLILNGTQRAFTTPTSQIDIGLEVSASRNSGERGAIYFNPRRDLFVLPSVTWSHTLDRDYKTAWNQQLRIGAGIYEQRDYDTGEVRYLSYGQRWSHDDKVDGGVTLTALRRPYDGEQETDYRLTFDLNLRF